MIHKLGTVIVTLLIIAVIGYVGLTLIRQFAFSIALENHEANLALDGKEDAERKRKIALADQAASAAYRKVEPLITTALSSGTNASAGSASSSPVGSKNVEIV